jgi:hypothetical protein
LPALPSTVLLGDGDGCPTTFTDGNVCGFTLPITSSGGNHDYRRSVRKHTTPAASGFASVVHSWTDTPADYARSQEFLLASGSLSYDSSTHYPVLVAPLCSGDPVATVHSPFSGSSAPARWAMMPLGPRPQDLHHHYLVDLAGLVPLASGDSLVVGLPAPSGGTYSIYASGIAPGDLLCVVDPAASGCKVVRCGRGSAPPPMGR